MIIDQKLRDLFTLEENSQRERNEGKILCEMSKEIINEINHHTGDIFSILRVASVSFSVYFA